MKYILWKPLNSKKWLMILQEFSLIIIVFLCQEWKAYVTTSSRFVTNNICFILSLKNVSRNRMCFTTTKWNDHQVFFVLINLINLFHPCNIVNKKSNSLKRKCWYLFENFVFNESNLTLRFRFSVIEFFKLLKRKSCCKSWQKKITKIWTLIPYVKVVIAVFCILCSVLCYSVL